MSVNSPGLPLLMCIFALCAAMFSGSATADVFNSNAELQNSWGVEQIGAGLVHEMGITGAGVKVGIIDSGIDYTHPELSANYAGGWNLLANNDNPFDDFGHGTQIAGIIGAAYNGIGIVGVAPEASLYAYKVYDRSGTNVGTVDLMVAALERAIVDGMHVVNMSLGAIGDPGLALFAACSAAVQAGITIVASVGNDGMAVDPEGNIHYPAAYDSVIAVGATDMLNMRSVFSNTGPELELVAPGEDVLSTDTSGIGLPLYQTVSGTSFAAAHVTGAAALLIDAGYTDARGRLILTAYDVGPVGRDALYGYGLVDVHAAVIPAPSAAVLALLGLSFAFRVGRFRPRC